MADRTDRKRKAIKTLKLRRRINTALFILLIALVIFGMQTKGFDNESMQKIGDPNAEAPEIAAEGAEIYSLNLEEPVYEKNADERIDPYSITKILTCYLAIENLDMDKKVKVSENAAKPLENGTTIYLKEGEKISVKNLLYGAMLESGNDAATALGEAVSGSEKKFAKLMNSTVKEWGCENTHFVNANGWKHKNQYTTAHDMAIIGAKVFENEELRKISMTKEYTIPSTNMSGERYLRSHTRDATKRLKNATCGKTGGWTSKDCSLVVGLSEGNRDEIIVLLRTTTAGRRFDPVKLAKFSKEVTPGFIAAAAGQTICEVRIKGGKKAKVGLCTAEDVYAYPKGQKRDGVRFEMDLKKLKAPVPKGTEAGTYTMYVDDKEIQSGAIYTAEDVEKGLPLSNLYISDSLGIVLAVFFVLWFVLIALIRRMR